MNPYPTETRALDWWLAKLAGERLPTHELPAELVEDLAAQDHKETRVDHGRKT